MMKDINIAATTALQTLRADAREQAIEVGANIIMPNITPQNFREQYFLYQNKTVVKDDAFAYHRQLEQAIAAIGCQIGYNEHGDSKHFLKGKIWKKRPTAEWQNTRFARHEKAKRVKLKYR